MPAGLYPAGVGAIGFAPVVAPGTVPPRVDPVAALLDGATRDFPLNADGYWKAVHPVDQEVEIALLVPAGSVASAPDVGHTLLDVDLGAASFQNDVADRVRRALTRPLARGDIEIVRIDASNANRQLRCAVTYRNLRSATPAVPLTRTYAAA